jgi:hypothetical protein
MADSAPSAARRPLVWRIPPWQPAILFLLASACAATNIYWDPSALTRVFTLTVAVAAVVMAVFATRMYLVVDEEGIGIRRLLREVSATWDDVENVVVVTRAFETTTLRVTRHDGTCFDVPASLVLPTRPTGKARVHAQLGDLARQLIAYGEPYRR